jgi:hypothetical protein
VSAAEARKLLDDGRDFAVDEIETSISIRVVVTTFTLESTRNLLEPSGAASRARSAHANQR